MGDQYMAQAVFRVAAQPGDDRLGVTGIDGGNLLALFVDQQPDVVVIESG